jgi:undecaprenyl-diphosphatase
VRPPAKEIPFFRQTKRQPKTTSFPSGHAASAFAFATAATIERPELAVPLFGLAAGVAYSRVHVGVHYPSDVVAGAIIGTGIGLATTRFYPTAHDAPATAERARLDDAPARDGTGLAIVVNPDAGPALRPSLDGALREALPGAEIIEVDDETPIDAALDRAAAAKVIGVCGGDGTVNAAVAKALEASKPLLVVPGGTLNHFARDLGIETLDDALAALRARNAIRVDVARIDDRVFVNTASFGSYVDLVRARERLEGRIGKWPAVVVALIHVARHATPLNITVNGRDMRIWLAFIGNCRYSPSGLAPTSRDRLDDGLLDMRFIVAPKRFPRLRLLAGARGSDVYVANVTDSPIEIASRDGALDLARDGEVFSGPSSFKVSKADEPLVVFAATRDGGSARR